MSFSVSYHIIPLYLTEYSRMNYDTGKVMIGTYDIN